MSNILSNVLRYTFYTKPLSRNTVRQMSTWNRRTMVNKVKVIEVTTPTIASNVSVEHSPWTHTMVSAESTPGTSVTPWPAAELSKTAEITAIPTQTVQRIEPDRSGQTQQVLEAPNDLCTTLSPIVDGVEHVAMDNIKAVDEAE